MHEQHPREQQPDHERQQRDDANEPGRHELTVDADSELGRALSGAIDASPPVDAPRIWAGSIPDYLAGTPHGRWIDAAQTARYLADEVTAMLDSAPIANRDGNPTWGIFAVQGFGAHEPDRTADLADIANRAHAACSEAGAFAAWIRLGSTSPDHYRRFGAAYQGHFDSLRDYVTLQVEAAGYDQLLDERIPTQLRPFVDIDIDGLAHDMTASGEISVIHDHRGKVWIFTNPPERPTEQSLR